MSEQNEVNRIKGLSIEILKFVKSKGYSIPEMMTAMTLIRNAGIIASKQTGKDIETLEKIEKDFLNSMLKRAGNHGKD